jgi:hypothetical protein
MVVASNFSISLSYAQKCMKLARATIGKEKHGARNCSFSQAMRDIGQALRGGERGGALWQAPVQQQGATSPLSRSIRRPTAVRKNPSQNRLSDLSEISMF